MHEMIDDVTVLLIVMQNGFWVTGEIARWDGIILNPVFYDTNSSRQLNLWFIEPALQSKERSDLPVRRV